MVGTLRVRVRKEVNESAVMAELAALDVMTLGALRRLAEMSLELLGAPRTDAFVGDEMLRQFSILSSAMSPDETDRDRQLQFLISTSLSAFESLD